MTTSPSPLDRTGALIPGAVPQRLLAAHAAAWGFYVGKRAGSWVPGYLEERGLGGLVDQAGYAPGPERDGRALVDHLAAFDFSERELVEFGLAKRYNGKVIDFFRDRVVLPIRVLDAEGVSQVVAFTGRRSPTSKVKAKWMNSPGTAAYQKSMVLDCLADQIDRINEGAVPALVEGRLDAEAITLAGEGRYVGINAGGTALTKDQIALLANVLDDPSRLVIVGVDSDDAGRAAAAKDWDLLATGGLRNTRRLELTSKDPAAVLEHGGPAALLQALDSATTPLLATLVEHRIGEWSKVLDHLDGQLGLIRSLAPYVRRALPEHADWATAQLVAAVPLDPSTIYHELGEDSDEDSMLAEINAASAAAGEPDNVTQLPGSDQLPRRSVLIPSTTKGTWYYVHGEEQRGVWWDKEKVAPLPYVKARVIRRDGEGRRTGMHYLLSVTPDSPAVLVDADQIARGSWANVLGLALPQDQKFIAAAATSILDLAERVAPEKETAARVNGDRIDVPVTETLPPGYLACSAMPRAEAIQSWGHLLGEVAASPKMALVLSASAVAPFIGALDRTRSHVLSLYGDAASGKSVTLKAAGALWGRPSEGDGVIQSWDMSKGAVTRFLGQLALLPAFLDETGRFIDASTRPGDLGKLIYNITQGGGRTVTNMKTNSVTSVPNWFGILFSTGNGRLTDGLGAGHFAGIHRRIIDLETPMTLDEEHAETIRGGVDDIWGHLGQEILARYTAEDIRRLIEQAQADLGVPEGPNGRQVAKHLYTHLAGARMLDEITGLEGTMYWAALDAASEYLETWAEPEHDADRMLDEIRGRVGAEPSMWPTMDVYLESRAQYRTPAAGEAPVAARALNRTLSGLMWEDPETGDRWVAVFNHAWKAMCAELGVDTDVACRELDRRKLLYRTWNARKKNENKVRVKQTGVDMYKIRLVEDDGEDTGNHPAEPGTGPSNGPAGEPADPAAGAGTLFDGDNRPGTGSERGRVRGGTGSVRGEVRGQKPPLTCEVRGVRGESAESTRDVREGAHTHVREATTTTAPSLETAPEHGLEGGHPPAKTASADAVIWDGGHQIQHLDPAEPCGVCGEPAAWKVDGYPVHWGAECFEEYVAIQQRTGAPPTPPAAQQAAVVSEAGPSVTAVSPESNQSTSDEETSSAQRKPDRFRAPAAVLEGDRIYLPGGEIVDWPDQIRHLGDLAMLASKGQLRLGHGGGENLPEPGQLWLDAEAVERVGLPEVSFPDEIDPNPAKARKAKLKHLAPIAQLPPFVDAEAEGWEIAQPDAWIKLRHPELLPGGVRLVIMDWINDKLWNHPLITSAEDTKTGEIDAARLADNLAQFARAVGVQFYLHSGVTAHRLINDTRPLRADEHAISGRNPNRVALIRGEASQLPPFYRGLADGRFTPPVGQAPSGGEVEAKKAVENDYAWWRPWESLTAEERECEYVHAYDRYGSYLEEWRTAEFGVDGLTHLSGDQAVWDGREKPGLWLIVRDWGTWPEPLLPEPQWGGVVSLEAYRERLGLGEDATGTWVTTMTLKALSKVGITPRIVEAYTWGTSSKYLELAAERLVPARLHPNPAVAAAAKALYTRGTGRFARGDGVFAQDPLWRPDWYDIIRASARFKILLTVQKIAASAGVYPVGVGHDTIVYVSNERDPFKAWPGTTEQLGQNPGRWAPEASARLAEWGPIHLPAKQPGTNPMWRSVHAVEAMASHKHRAGGAFDGQW